MRPEHHPYCYPDTDVLRNKEGIRDGGELEALERGMSASRLETLPRDLPITVAGFREIHRHMLQDVYEWAGEYRTVNTGRTAPFCKTDYIASEMDNRLAAINGENNLRGLTPEQFASRAAEHINEINAIHPFLDGNGRAQRVFLQVLAEQAGHEIDLAHIEPRAWNGASIDGFYRQDHEAMSALIVEALVFARERTPATVDGSRAADDLVSQQERDR